MVIDQKTYRLSSNNYLNIEHEKNQIVVGHTFNHDMNHFTGWLHRYHGQYTKTAPYTITRNGTIYEHFEPKYSSNFFNNDYLDNRSIVILLENNGWLVKNSDNKFIDWSGDIYKQEDKITKKKWRNHEYWESYTTEQINSTILLVNKLCGDFSIERHLVSHNTYINDLIDYNGILYKSNLEKYYTDLNPSWCFSEFKEAIENYK